MTTSKNAPALPVTDHHVCDGLTKREWFAGMIAASMANHGTNAPNIIRARHAVQMADALIVALNEGAEVAP